MKGFIGGLLLATGITVTCSLPIVALCIPRLIVDNHIAKTGTTPDGKPLIQVKGKAYSQNTGKEWNPIALPLAGGVGVFWFLMVFAFAIDPALNERQKRKEQEKARRGYTAPNWYPV